ncbi:site-2 protease family protein [Bacillota bacterium LX-D]|nr:site-2 protease family protein [Bacillota bacterium LX-D]
MFLTDWVHLIFSVPAILVAITFHEYAHGKMAALLGDPTPAGQGRLSLNPLKHLDPLGALLLILVGFGWAKPVQVNPFYFRGDKQKGMLYVALAGPLMNLVLAYLSTVALRISFDQWYYIGIFFNLSMWYNTMLAVFNLIPLPPLDGFKILVGLLPNRNEILYKLESYGPIILILLLATNVLGNIITPVVHGVLQLLTAAAGLAIY